MKIDILTLFPEMFPGVLNASILGRAAEQGHVDYNIVNYRDYTEDKHLKVDDYAYGGGAGMVLKPQPIFDAVEAIRNKDKTSQARIILMCPQGEPYNQKKAEALSKEDHLIFICGHYEGYDERIRTGLATDEISIGDYVLTGGEIGAMAVVDSVVRLIPGVLGNEASAVEDSFSTGLLEHPHYTRPQTYKGMKVPDVLMSGNHAEIEKWRRYESLKRTYLRRPDLLEDMDLSDTEIEWLNKIKKE